MLKKRADIRQEVRIKRRQLNAETQQVQANLLCQTLIAQIDLQHDKHIAIYLANDGELNTTPFITWCWQNNVSVSLPVIHPFNKNNLLFLAYTKTSIMIKNKYGIFEPKLDVRNIVPVPNIDIIFTPLVAFDNNGNRLGMGGGFYDRTLSSWYKEYQHNKNIKPMPIGLALDCQKVTTIPCESWDIPLPTIITPTSIYNFDL